MKRTQLVATMTAPPVGDGEALRALDGTVSVLEVRADRVGDLDADWLRDRFSGTLLYTLRGQREGGVFAGDAVERLARIRAQVGRYDLIDLEVESDGLQTLLAAVPTSERLLSWHGPSSTTQELGRRFVSMRAHPARFHKMIPTAGGERDGLCVLQTLAALQADGPGAIEVDDEAGQPVIFAGGPLGAWTRLLAPRLGSSLTYGALESDAATAPGAPGQPSIDQLVRDYGLPALPAIDRLFGIAGCPVAHSLSPRLHNGAYRSLGIPALYVPFHVESFDRFWRDVVAPGALDTLGFPLAGLSVTAPHKAHALAHSDRASDRARRIGAANTLVREEGARANRGWAAETTDPAGVVGALEEAGVTLRDCAAAVVGCGSAGRAAALGLVEAGMRVTLVNRGIDRGREAATMLELPFEPLATFQPTAFDVLVHATSLGRAGDPLPFAPDGLGGGDRSGGKKADHGPRAVLDLVYGHEPTPLLRQAAAAGARTIDGREVLVHQALEQFERMTGHGLDPGLAHRLLDTRTTHATRNGSR